MNSVQFCFSEKFFISFNYKEYSWCVEYPSFQLFFFLFYHLYCMLLLPLSHKVYAKKSSDSLLWLPYMWHFAFLFLPSEFSFYSFAFLAIICCSMVLFEILFLNVPCFLYLDVCFLTQVWEISIHNLFKYICDLLLPPLLQRLPILWLLIYLMLSQKTHKLVLFFFKFYFSDWVISIILYFRLLISYSVSLSLLCIPFSLFWLVNYLWFFLFLIFSF